MFARIIFHPSGFVRQAWRKTLRLATVRATETVATITPPLWPYRYHGSGLSLCSIFQPIPDQAVKALTLTAEPVLLPVYLDGFFENNFASFLQTHAA